MDGRGNGVRLREAISEKICGTRVFWCCGSLADCSTTLEAFFGVFIFLSAGVRETLAEGACGYLSCTFWRV